MITMNKKSIINLFIALLIVSGLVTVTAFHAYRNHKKITEKNIPHADIPDALIARNSSGMEQDVLVSAADTLRLIEADKTKTLLVDVRPAELFARVRIPGSVNIPLFNLKNKTFLHGKNIVLINEGYGYRQLITGLKSLDGTGAQSARILQGGLNAWKRAGGRLDADALTREEIDTIPPSGFFADKDYKDVAVVYVRGEKAGAYDAAKTYIPGIVDIKYEGDVEKFLKRIDRKTRVEDKAPVYVVVAADDEKLYDMLRPAVRKCDWLNMFYLRGGIRGYGQFLKTQVLMRGHAAAPSKKECPTCD